jgi:hypothetical protein
MERTMKKSAAHYLRLLAAALVATVLNWPAGAAGSVEDLKPSAASAGDTIKQGVSAGDTMRHGVPVRSSRTSFDEFSVIGDPLYRKGSMELLKKAVESGKEGEKVPVAKEKAATSAGDTIYGAEKLKPLPALKKAAPSARPADLRDAPSDTRKALPVPRMRRPAPRPLPADPVAPRKAS